MGPNTHQKLIGHDMPGLEWVLPKEKSFCFSRREREKYSVKQKTCMMISLCQVSDPV